MAGDLTLKVTIKADGTALVETMGKAQRESAAFGKSLRDAAREASGATDELDGKVRGLAQSIKSYLGPAIGGVVAAFGARGLMEAADTWSDLSARVGLAVGNMELAPAVMDRLSDAARRTYSSLQLTAESWLANARGLRELGLSTRQQLDLTEAINLALVVSGTRGERAASVQRALANAMALGKLSGDNFNTVMTAGGRIAQALAESLGVSTNELRKLAAEGKITGEVIIRALLGDLEALRGEAEKMPATIGDGVTLLRNAFLRYVGVLDQAGGLSESLAGAIVMVGDNMNIVAGIVAGVATAAVLKLTEILRETLQVRESLAAAAAREAELDRDAARVREDLKTATERYNSALMRLDELYQAGRISAEAFGAAVAKLDEELARAERASNRLAGALSEFLQSAEDPLRDVANAIGNTFREGEDALVDFVTTGKLEFASLVDSILQDLVRLAIRQAITAPLAGALMAGIGGLFAPADASPAAAGPPTALFGSGNAGTSGPLGLYAQGGVVTAPTFFTHSGGRGVAGEAGPEAILPLTRLPGGDLGVRAAGGQQPSVVVPVEVRVINQGAPLEVEGTRETIGPDGVRLIEVMVRGVARDEVGRSVGRGDLDRPLEQRFGLRPRSR